VLIIAKKFKKLSIFGLILALLGTYLFSAARVNAQGETRLSIQPVSADSIVGGTITVTVDVRNGSNLSGYDLTIAYDSRVISLESWSQGTYLSNLAVMHQENEPGLLRLAAVQLASPGVSGDGTLLNLKFRGTGLGRSGITFTHAELATANSELVIPGVDDGEIRIIQATLATPTSTNDLLPDLTPTGIVSTSTGRQATPTSQANLIHTPDPTQPESIGLPNRQTPKASPLPSTEPNGTLTASVENATQATQTSDSIAAIQSTGGTQPSGNLALVNNLLWALVVLLAGALIAMTVLHFTRKKKNRL